MPKQKYYFITIFVFVITSCNSKQTKEKADNRYSYQYNDIDYFTLEAIYSPELNSNCFVKRIIKDSLLIIEHYKNDSTLLGTQELEIKNGFYYDKGPKIVNFQFEEFTDIYYFKDKVVKLGHVYEKRPKQYQITNLELTKPNFTKEFYHTKFINKSKFLFKNEKELDSLVLDKLSFLKPFRVDTLNITNNKIELIRQFRHSREPKYLKLNKLSLNWYLFYDYCFSEYY